MSEQPRVFHLITRLNSGGAEAKTIQTVLGLDEYRFIVGHGAEYEREQTERLEENGVETNRFASIRHYNPITAVPAVFSVAQYIERRGFDIVHTHSTEAGVIGRLAANLAGTPTVVHTVHGVPFAEDRNAVLNRFVLQCERLAARRSDRIITNADAITRDYLERGIGTPEQYRTVYSGIDLQQFETAEPATDVDRSGVSVVMVGRFADGKGFGDLLAAVDRIDAEDLLVFLVGDGPIRDDIETTIVERGLEDTVHVLGYRDDVESVLAACDVFVLPSYREGTPRVITEAMASGLPIIATDIAGIPEQVEDGTNGFLIEPGDIDGLADRLEKLVSSPALREEFGAASQERVQRFSLDEMLKQIDSVYRELLSE